MAFSSSAALPEQCPLFLTYAASQGWLFLAIGPIAAIIASLLSGSYMHHHHPDGGIDQEGRNDRPGGDRSVKESFAVNLVEVAGLAAPLRWLGGCMAAVSKAHVMAAFKLACSCISGSYFLRGFLARVDEEVCGGGGWVNEGGSSCLARFDKEVCVWGVGEG